MSERRPFKRFKKEPSLTTEQKIEQFILRNSKNGYFTKVSTIPYKFGISENSAWNIVGELLAGGSLELIYDEFSGETKLCKTGKIYLIINLEKTRIREKFSSVKEKTSFKKEIKI